MIEKKARLVADVMEDIGNPGAAFVVRELIKQRAELLEALINLRREVILSDIDQDYMEQHLGVWLKNAYYAITKAEAAE